MVTFNTNQVRQLYVAKELKNPNVIETDKAGALAVKNDTNKDYMYFSYMGSGGMTRSDLIDVKNIMYAKATDANDLARSLTKYKITLDSTINEGNPVSGQDYLLRITFLNYIGISDEYQYYKYGTVHAVSGMTSSDFYKTLALSLSKNFSREPETLLKFYLEKNGNDPKIATDEIVEVTKDTKEADLNEVYTGLIIEEAPQPWILGVMEQSPVNFIIQTDQVLYEGDDRLWGAANKVASTSKVPNGNTIADLEYFCMGERGDTYRMVGFPHVIRTNYLVDPSIEYNVIDIHYAYVGPNESSQKSEKDITIVVPKTGEDNVNKLTNDIINAINNATGLNIATLNA